MIHDEPDLSYSWSLISKLIWQHCPRVVEPAAGRIHVRPQVHEDDLQAWEALSKPSNLNCKKRNDENNGNPSFPQ